MDIDHLQDGELFQDRLRCEPRCQGPKSLLQGDLQTIGLESDKDMRFDARILFSDKSGVSTGRFSAL